MPVKLSIIVPALNEAEQIESCLLQLQLLREQGHQVIVVDGGSRDDTVKIATPLCDRIITAGPSRSLQMNTGAEHAVGNLLLFLHADTLLPENPDDLIKFSAADNPVWGHFDIRLSGNAFLFRIIEQCMNIRSRLTGIATGDQAIFISRDLFMDIDGFSEIALMEDIEICNRLNKTAKPVCLNQQVISSSRRWENNGIIKTILKMWAFRLLFFFKYDTNKLAKRYG